MEFDWIAVDWGTSNLRAWAMAQGDVVAFAASDKGMGQLDRSGYEPALLDLIGPWIGSRPATVVACGMVGSRQGWVEAPYATAPCAPIAAQFTRAPAQRPGLVVHVIPGIKQTHPADVMRGEETQIAGFLAQHPGWDGVLCLPGTHTKWVHISAGEVVSFQTVMTGDLYAAISGATVLRHSVQGEGFDTQQFGQAVQDTISHPEKLAAHMFAIRAAGLLQGTGPAASKARLSGLLIGAELAATKAYWLGQKVAIIGAGSLANLYAQALALQAVQADVTDTDGITLAGLTAAYTALGGQK